MAKLEKYVEPIGWLLDPNNKWAIHFDLKKASKEEIASNFTIDMWSGAANSKAMKFKSRRKVSKKEALKTWKQLIASNWIEYDFEKNKTA